jgi:type III pantothenate kinase
MGRKLATFQEFSDYDIPKIAEKIIKSGSNINKFAIICSVVPKNEHKIIKQLSSYKSIKCLRLGKEIPLVIKSKYISYRQLGNDRKVNILGALKRISPPFVVFDFGTATTVDYVSSRQWFEGGMILPGIKSCLDLLHEKTALLPAVRIKPVRRFLGRDTRSGMLTGVLHGYGTMIRGLIQEFRRRYGRNLKTIGTGGLVDIVSRYCGGFDWTDRLLTLKAMGEAYEDWLKKR